MKLLGLVLSLFLSNGVAQADSSQGLYRKLLNRFESATQAPMMTDIPKFKDRKNLRCIGVRPNDSMSTSSIFKLSKQVNVGPIEPPKLVEKVMIAYIPEAYEDERDINSYFDLLRTEYIKDSQGRTNLTVTILKTDRYHGSPLQFHIRVADFIYYKVTNADQQELYVGYCYPAQTGK